MERQHSEPKSDDRKPYEKPAVKHELELEIRAGSPLNIPDPLDPFGIGK